MRLGILVLAIISALGLGVKNLHAEQALAVQTVVIATVPGKEVISVTGAIVARYEVELSFPMGGRIMSILVREGDHVQKGQELARLESVQQEQTLRGAEAALEATKADLFQAREEFERQDTFLQRGATTRIRRDEAERQFRITEASVERAKADLSRAHKTLDDTFLRANADGIITDRLADPGEVIAGAHPVLKLALGAAMDAIFDAPETVPTNIPTAMVVSLSLIDKPDVRFIGHIRKISPLVDPLRGTVEVSVGVDTPPKEVRYGAAVKASVSISHPARIVVPYSALSAIGKGPAVWVVDPETEAVSLRPITIARYSDSKMVVSTGLVLGDRVVTSGVQLLYPGRIVRLKGDQ